LTAYRNLPTPYATVPSPTPYGPCFSKIGVPQMHNLHEKYLRHCWKFAF